MSQTLDLDCGHQPLNPFSADEVYGVITKGNDAGHILRADLILGRLPFDDASFDYVTAFDCIAKIPRLICAPDKRNAFVSLMNEVYRVLRPGGIFLCQTPAYPHARAFESPAYVNVITDKTFPRYFDGVSPRAAEEGFDGVFRLRLQEWRNGGDLYVALMKVPRHSEVVWPVPASRKISVVVPVFNGEKYLAQTLTSLLAQSHQEFEVLCVDDCSSDGSFAILEAFAARDARVRAFSTERNMGAAPRVLNFALPLMSGDYFVYASQDDLFSTDWLEKMLDRAIETGADAVLPDVTYYYENDAQRNRSLIGVDGDRRVQLSGREAVMLTLGWKIPGNALWNAELIRKMRFAEFAVNSDEYSVRRFFNVANKVVFSEGEFLYRQDNANAVTKKKNTRYFDFAYTHLRLAHWLFEQDYPKASVLRELKSARKGMAAMHEWYAQARHDMTPEQRLDAENRIARYSRTLSDGHPLGRLPRRYW